MMTSTQLLMALCALLGVALISATILVGWQNWLAYKNRELDLGRATLAERGRYRTDNTLSPREGAARIELADLKERVRRLEAIANGVDL